VYKLQLFVVPGLPNHSRVQWSLFKEQFSERFRGKIENAQ